MACVDCWRWLWLLSFDKGGKVPKDPNWKVRPNPSLPLTRRTLLGGLMAAPLAAQSMGGALYAYVGCYTTLQRSARGDGIHVYRIDPQTGAWTHVQHVGGLVNPSFLVMAADQRHLYSVHGDETYATAFSLDRATGFLQPLNRAETGGRNGVHQAIAPGGRFLVVANYGAGNVGELPIRPDGALAGAVQVVALPGQPGPRVRLPFRCGHRQIDAYRARRRNRSRRLRPAPRGVPSPIARGVGGQRNRQHRHDALLGCRSRQSAAGTDLAHAATRPHRREYHRGDCRIRGRPLRLLLQPRTRQYRYVHIRSADRPAFYLRLDAVTGPHPSLHWVRSLSLAPLRNQRAVRHRRHLPSRRCDGPDGCHGSAGAKRKSGIHRFCGTARVISLSNVRGASARILGELSSQYR